MGKSRTHSETVSNTHECGLPPGEGDTQAELVFIGAGPSELLIKMIEAMGLKREQVFLAQTASCPGCNSLLEQQLEAMKPKVIVALGESALQALHPSIIPHSELRGQIQEIRGVRVMPTFHPDELIHSPASKREAWAHLQQVTRELGLKIPTKTEKKV